MKIVQIAPFKDPIYIDVDGSHIAIRLDIAKHIEIELIEDTDTP